MTSKTLSLLISGWNWHRSSYFFQKPLEIRLAAGFGGEDSVGHDGLHSSLDVVWPYMVPALQKGEALG